MRQQHTLEVLSGFHEGPTASVSLYSSWNFTTTGVQVGDVVENKTQGTNGTVLIVSDENTLLTDINFEPGDFFEITLSTEWSMSSNLGPTYENICGLCGKQVTIGELDSHSGRCKECYDPSHPSTQIGIR